MGVSVFVNMRGILPLARVRTLLAAMRTMIYGGLAALVGLTDIETIQVLEAAVLGAVMADYVTWLVRSLLRLPGEIGSACYEAAVNIVFAWFLIRTVDFQFDPSGQTSVAAFLSFLLMTVIKMAFYGAQYVQETLAED